MANKNYKYYACYKNSRGGGTILEGRDTCEEAWKALKSLAPYVTNDTIFIGVIKSRGNNPLSHICHLNDNKEK
jgi:hypothetical protein